jgi:hypothetical protein
MCSAFLLLSGTAVLLCCSTPYEPTGQFQTEVGPAGAGARPPGSANDSAGDPEVLTPGTGKESTVNEGLGNSGTRLDPGSGSNNSGTARPGSNTTGAAASMGGSGATSAGNSATAGVASQTCSLGVSVTTTAPGGRYAPRNVGAIWIADASDRFIKSLDVWGTRRLSHATLWNTATKAAGVPGNKVDAVSSATLSAHRTHDVAWDCQDYSGQVVPDGTYRVYFEITDSNGSGPNHFEAFTKGPMASMVQSSATNFNNIVLSFKP